jgi:hypothetical protein
MRFTRVLLPIVVVLLGGCATQPDVAYPQNEVFNILEAALRSRLATMPLPRHSRCYVSIERADVAIAAFAKRFPEYQMIMRNSPGNLPSLRWYHLRLGKTTRNDAWVLLEDAAGYMGYHLRHEDGGWVVVFSERPVLT